MNKIKIVTRMFFVPVRALLREIKLHEIAPQLTILTCQGNSYKAFRDQNNKEIELYGGLYQRIKGCLES